jgi:hypothetical protein
MAVPMLIVVAVVAMVYFPHWLERRTNEKLNQRA